MPTSQPPAPRRRRPPAPVARGAAILTLLLLPIGAAMADDKSTPTPGAPNVAAPAQPGHLAELAELKVARREGTRAAYDLWLARHPHSRYADTARAERAALPR